LVLLVIQHSAAEEFFAAICSIEIQMILLH